MTIEEATEVIRAERECVSRQMISPCNRNCAKCDLVLEDTVILSAYDMAISALRAQQEAEKNEPLTLEELREMHGEPVWISSLGIYKKSFRSEWAINDCELGRAESMGTIYRAANYGKTWLAYRHHPDGRTGECHGTFQEDGQA